MRKLRMRSRLEIVPVFAVGEQRSLFALRATPPIPAQTRGTYVKTRAGLLRSLLAKDEVLATFAMRL